MLFAQDWYFKAFGLYRSHLQVFVVSEWVDFYTWSSFDECGQWGHLMLVLNARLFFRESTLRSLCVKYCNR